MAQVAVLLARRTDADHRHVAVANGLGKIGGAPQALVGNALLQQGFEARFHDGGFALVDQVDLGRRYIHADHFMAPGRQAARTDRTYITQTKDADTHRIHLMCLSCRRTTKRQTGLVDQQIQGARKCHG
uniref:Transposase n=1 Tax=Steinernema glaseri TaxID=37863 RepID=A0A1I7YIJ7_9BILA